MKAKFINDEILLIPESPADDYQLCNILANYKVSGDLSLDPFNLVIPLKKINHAALGGFATHEE